jgi:hypothetical protein
MMIKELLGKTRKVQRNKASGIRVRGLENIYIKEEKRPKRCLGRHL